MNEDEIGESNDDLSGLYDSSQDPVQTDGIADSPIADDPGTDYTEVPGTVGHGSDQVIGPGHAEDIWWQGQSANGLCVPVSVAQIVSEFSGQPFSLHLEGEVASAALNLLDPAGGPLLAPDGAGGFSGMSSEGAVALLEHYGIDAHTEYGSLETLAEYLSEGREIILAVDSDEVWYGQEPGDTTDTDKGADHALRITGIDPARGIAILQDPGQAEGGAGRGYEIPLDLLENAWADGGHEMVVTDELPEWQQGPGLPMPDVVPAPGETPVAPADVTTAPAQPSVAAGVPTETAIGARTGGEGENSKGIAAGAGIGQQASTWARGGAIILPIFLVGRAVAGKLRRR